MCVCVWEPLNLSRLLTGRLLAYSLIWYNNGSSFIVLFLWIQCFEYLIELTRLTHTVWWMAKAVYYDYTVYKQISETGNNVYVFDEYTYIVRIRIKIIHARHTRFFIVVCLESTGRAFPSLNSSWMRKNSQRSPHSIYIYITTWKYIYIYRWIDMRPSIVCGPLCPFLLCQAVFHLQACSYTYKCSNNTNNNNLSLVQRFQTSSIHRQVSYSHNDAATLVVIPNFSEQSILCYIRRWKYVYVYICSTWCQSKYRSKMKKTRVRIRTPQAPLLTHFHSPLKKERE